MIFDIGNGKIVSTSFKFSLHIDDNKSSVASLHVGVSVTTIATVILAKMQSGVECSHSYLENDEIQRFYDTIGEK
jgi:hypothetical protein